ncbi:GntR family transcriptional regulator [Symbiopectobacterium sp. RP]|uniref:GntR family transcriptional regulator n=1 Tax=Symbiopectobacterium sp. RP TaxID=3248553 RepID=UPI003D29F318
MADKAQHEGLNHPLACLEDLFFLAKNNPRVVKRIDEVVADYDLAQTIGCEPGSRWLHVASIREDSENKDAPICLTDSYASATFTKVRQLVRSDLIETHYGIQSEEVRQTISAVTVSAKIAKVLGVELGSPTLKIVRCYQDRDGNTFETTISVHPADRYACSIVLTRAKG